MRKPGKGEFTTTSLSVAMVCLALLVLAAFPVPASAAGTAGDKDGDAKIQAMRSDIETCMQPGDAGKKAREAFAKKYNVPAGKLNENLPGPRRAAGNGGWDYTTSYWVCGAETMTGVGAVVWEVRRKIDNINDSIASYCIRYSMKCDHYNWRPGCFK